MLRWIVVFIFVIIGILLLVSSGLFLAAKNGPSSFPPAPMTPEGEACVAAGGQWIIEPCGMCSLNHVDRSICRLPTHDAGKSCRDMSECESACVAPDPYIKNPFGITGSCHPWKPYLGSGGCWYTVVAGNLSAVCS